MEMHDTCNFEKRSYFLHLLSLLFCFELSAAKLHESNHTLWDKRGYIIYCPCMGRFGNQAEHFLGSLGFSKKIDRTLILPPWRTYKNVPFDKWFQVEAIAKFHRVILAEDFMTYLAPLYWPSANRMGWCWLTPGSDNDCRMKEGNPFGPFWNGLGVDFNSTIAYHIGYADYDIKNWKTLYPPEKYPVIAMKGAPASFPIHKEYVPLHQYVKWSEMIEKEASKYINDNFSGQKFVGIHLRNGEDWVNACQHAEGLPKYMASPQCLGHNNKRRISKNMCVPSKQEVCRLSKNVVISSRAKVVFVATDKDAMIKDLQEHLKLQKVKIFHLDPWLPQIDLAILGKATHFIGNCISSFSSFVARERLVKNQSTSYWGFS